MNFAALLAASGDGTLNLPQIEYSALYPILVLIIGAGILLLFHSLTVEKATVHTYAAFTSLIGLAAIGSTWFQWDSIDTSRAHTALAGAIALDRFSVFFAITIGAAVALVAPIAGDWLKRRHLEGPEFFVLMMLPAAGGMIMAAANDLIVVFLGLEILSIALYVLAGMNGRSDRSREAALKYFILGGFSSAIFLYGVALVYGATGTTNLGGIATFLSTNVLLEDGLLLAGVALLAVGLAFKVAAVPFHQWTPDVYQGSPTPAVAFMAAAAKAAGFAAFLRIFASTFYTLRLDWQPIILVLAILTLIVGSVAAVVQKNVKRMLAYSSISHAGYVLLGLQAATVNGISGSLFYLFTYTFIVIGSFGIVSVIEGRHENEQQGLSAFRGLAKRNPGVAISFTVLLLAQAGVPLTSGFLAEFYVVGALVENGSYATATFAMVIAAVAAFFYLRLVFLMFSSADETATAPTTAATSAPASGAPAAATHPATTPIDTVVENGEATTAVAVLDPDDAPPATEPFMLQVGTWLAVAVSVLLTVGIGVIPSTFIDFIDFARRATTGLF